MDTDKKINKRHTAIKELIASDAIEDQQTLVTLLQNRHGLSANQSIISRDLRALGVNKRKINNKMIYELQTNDASREILQLAVIDILHNESLIVVHTLPGLGAFVADFLDMHHDCGILGTIAGENTIFVTPTKIKNIKQIMQKIRTLLYIKTNTVKDSHE